MCSLLYVVVVVVTVVAVVVVLDVFFMAVITAETRGTKNHIHSPSWLRSYRRSGRLSTMEAIVDDC